MRSTTVHTARTTTDMPMALQVRSPIVLASIAAGGLILMPSVEIRPPAAMDARSSSRGRIAYREFAPHLSEARLPSRGRRRASAFRLEDS